MSTQTNERIPALTLGWRLKMALGDDSAQAMADYLGVSRQTLSRWCNDVGAPPKRAYLMQWALRTDVPLEWLESGQSPTQPDGPNGGVDGAAENLAKLASSKRSATRDRNTPRYPALTGAAA